MIAAYLDQVEAAFAALGEDQLRLYRETTGPPPVEVVDAVLVRERIRLATASGDPRALHLSSGDRPRCSGYVGPGRFGEAGRGYFRLAWTAAAEAA